jgi:transposase
METGKRGLKRGLRGRPRTVILMLDETIITETPPLSSCYRPKGQQVRVPITGHHAKRVVHGALNIRTGAILLFISEVWDQSTHQYFLTMLRSQWRGWHIVLFEDRGTPHTAEESVELATQLQIELRFLPVATPALNAMDHLWRHMKARGLSNRVTASIDISANAACQYLLELSPRERLKKAGVLSGKFWLAL